MCSGVDERVRRLEVRRFEEQAAERRHEEHDDGEQREEQADADDVLERVVRMERNAVDRLAVGAEVFLDLDAIRIVGADLAQRDQVQHDQQREHERQRDDVQREEAGQRGIADAVVAADPFHQVRADDRDRAEQVDDDLRAPVRHVAPGQHVAHERLGHQREVDRACR